LKVLIIGVVVVLLLFVGLSVYVRTAPLRPLAVEGQYTADTDLAGGYVAVRRFQGEARDLIARVTQIADATPRTRILSTDPLRFVTRSRVMGFPDITQVFVRDGVLTIHAHLVFGSSDLGVNKARVLAWLDQLGPL
tara:strand:+ start:41241 stop:41648 length:408 start_codon:yes stop_codon:yes gene_type:complete